MKVDIKLVFEKKNDEGYLKVSILIMNVFMLHVCNLD